ncbi:MAG: single-stranded-DNA-specific exonuclease RecJ [Pseudomonadota bacterium]
MSQSIDPFDSVRSVTERRWTPRLDAEGERTALALAQRYSLPEVVARVLAGRGVTVASAAVEMEPTIRELLPDPSTLVDCDKLVGKLADAVEAKHAITLFADYDVDGATSAAVAARTLRAFGVEPAIVVPDRVTDGYGPSVALMEVIAAGGAEMVLALDCGAGAVEPVERANALGLEVLVIDHHPVNALAPAEAVVNPNRADDLSGLGDCAAVGVTFVVMVGLMREMRRRGHGAGEGEGGGLNLLSLLDCVALGTVADVVPLSALNRAFVRRGLTALSHRTNPGLAALSDGARIGGPVAAHHLGFVLGPRINAGGRIGDAGLGARLLTTENEAEAARIAQTLEDLNRERRRVEQEALAEAQGKADPDEAVILVAGDWHPGVVGLVASRLKEQHRRPAFALAVQGETATGSGRSIKGVDLGAAVRACVEQGLLVKGGGHPMAAGLTVEAARIDELRADLACRLQHQVSAAQANAALSVDGVIAAGAIDEPLARSLAELGPWGAGRDKPVFVLDQVMLDRVQPVGADSLRLSVRDRGGGRAEAMLFRATGPLGDALKASRGRVVSLAVEVGHGAFRGVPRADVVVVDVALPDMAARKAA